MGTEASQAVAAVAENEGSVLLVSGVIDRCGRPIFLI